MLVESYLDDQTQLLADEDAVVELICGEILVRESCGEKPQLEEYALRFPKHVKRVRGQLPTLRDSALRNNGGEASNQLTRVVPASQPPSEATVNPQEVTVTRDCTPNPEAPSAGSSATDPFMTRAVDVDVATDPLATRADDAATDPMATRVEDSATRVGAATDPTVTAPPSGERAAGLKAKAEKDGRGRLTVEGYEILDELGRGGMGVVYKAMQTKLKRLVALKMVLAGAHASTMELARFRAEAEAVARLQHPNIVQIYEVGEQDGCPFFSLEYIAGGTLNHRLSQPISESESLTVIEKLARAVHAAHLRGIIHRDLKPGNVLLMADGTPKLTDFGLAKVLDEDAKDKGVTRSGAIMGTPSYMAPEQASGRIRDIGPGTDIYALGAMLYEMLTGRPPFKGATLLDTLEQLRTMEPVAPRSIQAKVSRDVETICLKCLQKDPKHRYVSAEALADDLHSFLVGEPIKARPTPTWERVWKWGKRRPMLVSLLAVICAAFVGVLGLVVFHYFDLQRQVAKARADVTEVQRGQLRAEVQESIQKGESAVTAQKWVEAERFFISARDKLGAEEGMDDVRTDIEDRLAEIRPKLLDQEGYRNARNKYEEFKKLHNDAIFHGSLCTGTDAASSMAVARSAAESALELFGVSVENAVPPTVDPRFFNEGEKGDITLKCYELLLVVAEAAAPRPPPAAGKDQRPQAEEALRILDRAAKLGFPVGKAYHLRRARYLTLLGDAARAARETQLADQLKATVPLAYFWLGDEMFKQGNLAQAVLEFENTLRLQPNHFWAQYLLAVCQLRMQRPAQAKTSLTACLSLRADFLWIYTLRGFAHGELAEYDAAFADFDKALASNPDAMPLYGVHVNRGVTRLRQGKLDEAVADLQKAIELNPKQFQAHVNLAMAYQKQKKLDDALRELDEAATLEPASAALYRNRARLQLARHQDQAALGDFDKAIALEPKDSMAPALVEDHVERGQIFQRARSHQGALQSANQALKLNADFAPAHRLRGEALLDLGDPRGAIQEFDVYLKAEKTDAAIY